MISAQSRLSRYSTSYLFILPAFLFVIVFLIYPVVESLHLSFFKWDGFTQKVFVGLENYKTMFRDASFFNALKNTVMYMATVTVIITLVGFALAIIMDLEVGCWRFYKFVFFLPAMLSQVVVSLLWIRIYNPRMGLLNGLLDLIRMGLLKQQWLGNPKLALFCVIAVNIWMFSGLNMIYFLASLQHIDPDIYSAAAIDGASTWRRIFSITTPMIKDQFILITLINLIYTAKVFDFVWVMTLGGPGDASQVFGTLLYYDAFRYLRFGYASVISVIVFVLSLVFAVIYLNYGKFHRVVTRTAGRE